MNAAACTAGLALVAAMAIGPASAVAQDTSFLSGEALAARLTHNLAWIAAEDIGEHGFGLIVGGDGRRLWVATARHVVVRTGLRGSGEPDQPSQRIRLRLCAAGAQGALLEAQPQPGFDAGGEDLALLSVAAPGGFEPLTRASAPPPPQVGETVWLLGSNDECAAVPEAGRVRAIVAGRPDLRVDFTGVQGGSSGAPVVSGRGVLGLMKSAEDLTTTVHDLADLQRRVQAVAGVRWQLGPAHNIPPTDPRAAGIDIAETLNQYLLSLRNVHMLLQMPQVARPTLKDYLDRYNGALNRFLRVREAYDGSFATEWPPTVLPAWRQLRDALWALHLNFWRMNPQMSAVYTNQKTPPELRAQLQALEPELQSLEAGIKDFLALLVKEP